jgi:hypothetical protein
VAMSRLTMLELEGVGEGFLVGPNEIGKILQRAGLANRGSVGATGTLVPLRKAVHLLCPWRGDPKDCMHQRPGVWKGHGQIHAQMREKIEI